MRRHLGEKPKATAPSPVSLGKFAFFALIAFASLARHCADYERATAGNTPAPATAAPHPKTAPSGSGTAPAAWARKPPAPAATPGPTRPAGITLTPLATQLVRPTTTPAPPGPLPPESPGAADEIARFHRHLREQEAAR